MRPFLIVFEQCVNYGLAQNETIWRCPCIFTFVWRRLPSGAAMHRAARSNKSFDDSSLVLGHKVSERLFCLCNRWQGPLSCPIKIRWDYSDAKDHPLFLRSSLTPQMSRKTPFHVLMDKKCRLPNNNSLRNCHATGWNLLKNYWKLSTTQDDFINLSGW